MREIEDTRLLRLAAYLDTVPVQRFTFWSWVGKDWQGMPDLSCGTTACALGFCSAMPEFQALGLYLERWADPRPEDDRLVYAWPTCGPVIPGETLETRVERRMWPETCAATRKIFGITARETEYLFTPRENWTTDEEFEADSRPERNATPGAVAEHIRRFVRKGVPTEFALVSDESE